MFCLQRLDTLNITEDIVGEKTKARTIGISHLGDRTSVTSWTEKLLLPVRAASNYVHIPMKHHLFHPFSF